MIKVVRGDHTVDLGSFEPQNEGNANSTRAAEVRVILDVAADATLRVNGGILQTWTANNQQLPSKHSGIRKTGPGTAVLQGTDYATQAANRQYSLDTEIDGGLLLANVPGSSVSTFGALAPANTSGSQTLVTEFSSEVFVNAGGTLGGTGGIGVVNGGNSRGDFRIGGKVIVKAGGTIAPGDARGTPGAVGTLTLNNGLSLHDGSRLAFELAEVTSDLLRIPAGTFAGSPSVGGVTVSLLDGGGVVAGNSYVLIDFRPAAGELPSLDGVDVSDFQLAPGPFSGSALSIVDDQLMVTISRPVEIVQITRTGNSIAFRFSSTPGQIYAVEASSDLPTWSEIDGNVVGEAGSTTTGFTEQPVPAGRARFYRVRQ